MWSMLFNGLLVINMMQLELLNKPLCVHTMHAMWQWQLIDVLYLSCANWLIIRSKLVVLMGYLGACVFDQMLLCYDQNPKTTSKSTLWWDYFVNCFFLGQKWTCDINFQGKKDKESLKFSLKWKCEHLQFEDNRTNSIWWGRSCNAAETTMSWDCSVKCTVLRFPEVVRHFVIFSL